MWQQPPARHREDTGCSGDACSRRWQCAADVHPLRRSSNPHLRNVISEQRIDASQVGDGQLTQLAALVLGELHRRARDVMRLTERHPCDPCASRSAVHTDACLSCATLSAYGCTTSAEISAGPSASQMRQTGIGSVIAGQLLRKDDMLIGWTSTRLCGPGIQRGPSRACPPRGRPACGRG